MHLILGAGGSIGNILTQKLVSAGQPVRLASRKPVSQFAQIPWVQTDLLQKDQVNSAAKGATVAYLCAGLKYDRRLWAEQWPAIMNNVIEACSRQGVRLIFFDNVYMYGLVHGAMVESTPYRPISIKGEIRARIAEQLMSAADKGVLKASIARAADFYGGSVTTSVPDMLVMAKYAKKQKAMWTGNPDRLHSYTYLPDAGHAVFLLGQHTDADNQVWHLPTAPPITGKQFLTLAAANLHTQPSFTKINKLMLKVIGLFDRTIGEVAEMYYQYDHDYIFDSSKFESHFKIKPTPYVEGIATFSRDLSGN